MMGPRANFVCAPCAKASGVESPIVHEDLPVGSKACPFTGRRRGFKRLFDGVQVSTTGHRVAKILDPMMRPQLEERDRLAYVKESEKRLVEEHEKVGLNKVVPRPVNWVPAGGALTGVDPRARYDSRNYIFPALKHRVIPARF